MLAIFFFANPSGSIITAGAVVGKFPNHGHKTHCQAAALYYLFS
jgi:hypothetical protein